MRVALALLAALSALGCSRDEQSNSMPVAEARGGAAADSSSPQNAPPHLNAARELPDRTGPNPFGAPGTPAIRHAPALSVQRPANSLTQPPPFEYVGKVLRARIRYAVLARDDRVFLVRANDTLDRYTVQSVNESEVVLVSSDTGGVFSIAFSPTTGTSAALPLSAVPGVDDASLEVSAPGRVSVGEEFTLTVSLDSGVNTVLETGRVEVRYDPGVLQIPGQSTSSGVARLDIAGAYAGHPMPATLQFRVVAAAPTTTEIRVVPTSIADTEGHDVGVNTPQPHRLTIVRAATPGG
jgi:hypothetical protein